MAFSDPQHPHTTLRDQLYMLAHERDGQLKTHLPSLRLGLAAAVVIDLIHAQRLSVTGGRIHVNPTFVTLHDSISADTLTAITYAGPGNDLHGCLRWLAGESYERTRAGLYAAGHLLRREQKRLLGGTDEIWRPRKPEATEWIAGPLFRALHSNALIDTPTYALAGLVRALHLHNVIGVDLNSSDLLDYLGELAERSGSSVRETLHILDRLIGDVATAAFR